MKIVVLAPIDDEAWALMPKFLRRVGIFANRYNPGEDITAQLFALVTEFSIEKGGYYGAVLLDDENEVCGHAMWSLDSDELGRNRWITIHQVEIDRDANITSSDRRRAAREFIQWIEDFAAAMKASEIRVLALSDVHARYYKRYGFVVSRLLMTKPVRNGGDRGVDFDNVS